MNIEHDTAQQQFIVMLTDDETAFIKYNYLDEGASVDFYSTFTPTSQRGKGLAAKLVQAAFAWADENNLKILSSCWYAAKILDRVRRN